MTKRLPVPLAILLLVLLGIQSCSDLGSESPQTPVVTGPVSFQNDIYPLFSQYSCNNCHSNGLYAWYGTTATTYSNLVNVTATAGCTDKALVLPGNASESVLYLRLSGNACGDRMPRGGNPIAPSHLTLVGNWINEGSANN